MRLGHPTRSITAIAASCVLAVSVICLRADIGFALGAKGASSTSPGAGATPPIASAGFWLVTGNGSVSAFGGVSTHGSPSPSDMSAPIAAMVSTPSGLGYWLAGSNGSLFAYGDASSLGSVNNLILRAPIVGMADTPSGMGYWLVAADGGVFCFGDAGFRGSLGNIALSSPIVAVAPTPTGNGYWLVGSDGSVYSFGDATFHGSLMGSSLAGPITGIASTGTGSGYWLAGSDGGVFAFGDAPFLGSASGSTNGSMIEGIGATHTGDGYILADSAGSTYSFGDAPTFPSQISLRTIGSPVVALALAGPIIGGNVLLVGTYNGIPGAYSTIQSAVDAAKPGDWILVAPGDYHESNDLTSGTSSSDVASGWYAGVDISTPDLHLRGMNRNTVVVDGTKPGSPQCSSNPADQQFGATGIPGISGPVGRNGIEVWKANDVSIENLTVCNFLSASGNGGGNEIWWNGSSANSTIGLTGYTGNYLTATDTFYGTYNGISGGGVYGIFSSAAAGPGVWGNIYASNFDDSGMYIGACRQQCDVWVHDAWMENNALGYSGTNSGGTVVIDRSQFDNNED
ncbi:MAG TPA: hypothetical protein VMU77_06980, partial [Acidimicrobiales bacterium]|nr:hypothetical protein [Acidimicrobiales bacterium]